MVRGIVTMRDVIDQAGGALGPIKGAATAHSGRGRPQKVGRQFARRDVAMSHKEPLAGSH